MEKYPPLKEKLRMVIFCGGYGTRMWPMSRQSLPKQFQPLLGKKSFFQDTYARLRIVFKPQDIFISVPQEQVKFIRRQVAEIPPRNIIAEPERRDTFGAIGFATMVLQKRFPDSLMGITWQDHYIRDKKQYARTFELAARVCQQKKVICKIDVKPPYPAPQLGWVKIGKKTGRVGNKDVYQFKQFIEKPGLKKAQRLFRQKNFLVNTGYYVWRTSAMIDFWRRYTPKDYRFLKKIQSCLGKKGEKKLVAKHYRQIEKTSIDYAIFEKLSTGDMLVIPVDLGWHDVGTWDLFYEALARGQKQNLAQGEVFFRKTKGSLAYLPKGKIAALIGVDNLVVVDTPDGLLVCKRGLAGEVKKFVNYLKEKGKDRYL